MIVALLVGFACVVIVLCAIGFALVRDPLDKLHYVGPLSSLAPLAVAAAIVYEEGFSSQAALKSLCIAAVMLVLNPMASYVTLRAVVVRERGTLGPPEPPVLQ